ncbi:nucleotidyltransferase family protein [Rhizobium sp. NRK18]|uniref:nucleotidyltransferase family protein n=1 Tax=Rhizobium sp. NRK18 TaxID=2964667 RepID=UPI0021C4323D|nr:nucleotidyltransferase family protein [Rhizobium sp. NRK18]MCQ2005405.1 nucleotidyltransferase family protein [Rhizobium sp. NRK18]
MSDTGNRPMPRFPNADWAWPRGSLDQLLQAVLLPDGGVALSVFRLWLQQNDIDHVSFREHRLLAAIAARFGKALSDCPEYPRLVGLQRMLWTRSRMALKETLPTLARMADSGLPVMLIKGASRIAINPVDQKARISHDVDIMVPREDLRRAVGLLKADGWESASGHSMTLVMARADWIRSANFMLGHFGDIDLHGFAFHSQNADPVQDEAIWSHALKADFFGVPVLVPDAADRLAIALAHGGLDAHTHSDWLVDCAAAIRDGAVDWTRFLEIVAVRRLTVVAEVAFTYLAQRMEVSIPAHVLERLASTGGRHSLSRYSALLQVKPRSDWGRMSAFARGVAKQLRLRSDRRQVASTFPRIPRGRLAWRGMPSPVEAAADVTTGLSVVNIPAGGGWFDLVAEIDVEAPAVRRRMELELNSATRHVVRLRARKWRRSEGWLRIRFAGTVWLAPDDGELTLESRPGKFLRQGETGPLADRYRALPFVVRRFGLTFVMD